MFFDVFSVCKFCSAAFTQFNHLKLHTKIHTNERPYPCPTCGKKYTSPSGLRTHRKQTKCGGDGDEEHGQSGGESTTTAVSSRSATPTSGSLADETMLDTSRSSRDDSTIAVDSEEDETWWTAEEISTREKFLVLFVNFNIFCCLIGWISRIFYWPILFWANVFAGIFLHVYFVVLFFEFFLSFIFSPRYCRRLLVRRSVCYWPCVFFLCVLSTWFAGVDRTEWIMSLRLKIGRSRKQFCLNRSWSINLPPLFLTPRCCWIILRNKTFSCMFPATSAVFKRHMLKPVL